jgi:hypothetical protein
VKTEKSIKKLLVTNDEENYQIVRELMKKESPGALKNLSNALPDTGMYKKAKKFRRKKLNKLTKQGEAGDFDLYALLR